MKQLKRAVKKHNLPMRIFTEDTMPSAYHYTGNPRIPKIILEAKEGWTIDNKAAAWHPKGVHGYGRNARSMDGIFIGYGPAFRKNPRKESIPFHSNLNVYPLVCDLLDLVPEPHNGTSALIVDALK